MHRAERVTSQSDWCRSKSPGEISKKMKGLDRIPNVFEQIYKMEEEFGVELVITTKKIQQRQANQPTKELDSY